MKMLHNNKGAVLVTMLMLLVIVTIIGIIAVNTTTVEIQILGNLKREFVALEVTEAGVDLCIPIIEGTIAAGTLTPTSFVIGSATITPDSTLQSEIQNDQMNEVDGVGDPEVPKFNTDIAIPNLAHRVAVELDIDRMYAVAMVGGSLEFASGYEGIGAGAGGGGVGVFYKINSRGTL